ncbi:hypothetical protein [Lewinella sp. JB7]|uniref:hypothetical protein n=1 Tax=Lewinella sp. JB7 TaxID=2962887 RepID=UPI0020C9C154|nr:hypothetical protein [Lewinella sp. JB7]MCP9235758.1 hypothetical protein [Lewinella sp. JB7]
MRIVGRLPDARMQITVFENDGRFPVQFELAGITQIYRFRKGERLSNFGHLREYVDEPFRAAVLRQFREMQRVQAEVLQRILPSTDEGDALPDIV